MSLFIKKPVALLQTEASSEHGLRRSLTALNLVSLGVGAVIGAGIFVFSGQAAAEHAGPAIVFSFIISGLGCLFAGLCYAEFAAMIPIAGSAYTYSYATLGELFAWIIGWDLILEYLFASSGVAVGWSSHMQSFLHDLGFDIPAALSRAPVDFVNGHWVSTGALFDRPAVLIVLIQGVLLGIGIKESANFNNGMVFIKVAVLLAVIGFGAWYIFNHRAQAIANWTPFIPENTGPGQYGWSGILRGASVIFFAYIGFDAVSTAAQEARNPQKDMPKGIIGSLLICTAIFIAVSLVITGMMKYTELRVGAPVVFALQHAGAPLYFRFIVEIAAIAGLSSVMLVMLMAQPRIFMSMANDGLLPPTFARVHPRFRTPYVTTILTCLVSAVFAGLAPLKLLGDLVNIGTLFAFVVVCFSVIVLRWTQPNLPRHFRTPWVPLVPLLGAGICFWQMYSLPWDTWVRLFVWMLLGLGIYFGYSRRHSKLNNPAR